jgi:hypothetical protein
MVIIQSTGDPGLVTEARIQIIRDIIDANDVISEDVAREIRRIRFAPSQFENQELMNIVNENDKAQKIRELAALSAYNANRGFQKTVDQSIR